VKTAIVVILNYWWC